jgi:hypothetical protein
MVLAYKYYADYCSITNSHWAIMGGVDVIELGRLEVVFFSMLECSAYVDQTLVEAIYKELAIEQDDCTRTTIKGCAPHE